MSESDAFEQAFERALLSAIRVEYRDAAACTGGLSVRFHRALLGEDERTSIMLGRASTTRDRRATSLCGVGRQRRAATAHREQNTDRHTLEPPRAPGKPRAFRDLIISELRRADPDISFSVRTID